MSSRRRFEPTPDDPSRRRFLKLALAGVTGLDLLGTSAMGYGYLIETGRLVHERIRLPVPDLPAALDGFRIVQLSDLHVEPFTPVALIERAVEKTTGLAPDLIVVTGDLVTTEASGAREFAPLLAELRAPHGVWNVFGNHDLWAGAARVRRALERVGLPVLVNESATLDVDGARLTVAGLDDGWAGDPDLAAALASAPDDAPVLLLVHEPDLVDSLDDPRVRLQLSGHSHGGQVRIPGIGAPILPELGRRYPLGLYRVKGRWLYTNRGLGLTGVPLRIACPPELTEIVLTRGPLESALPRRGASTDRSTAG